MLVACEGRLEVVQLDALFCLPLVAQRSDADRAAGARQPGDTLDLRRQPHRAGQHVVLRVEAREVMSVLARRRRRRHLSRLQQRRLQAVHAVVQVPKEARLALLAVAGNVDPGFGLPPHHVGHRGAHVGSERLLVVGLGVLLGPHRLHDRRRAHQAADVSGQDSLLAAPHRYQSSDVARAAPSESAESFAQQICGCTRPPMPQSVPAITFSRPTSPRTG